MRTAFSLALFTVVCGCLVAAAPTPSNTIAARSPLPALWYSLSTKRGQGGSASSGDTGDVNGGDIVSEGDSVNNAADANVAVSGGTTVTGDAVAGNGSGSDGSGGDASSGNAGDANGGSIYNYGGDITNAAGANTAGAGGESFSGNAYGGDASVDST
ncbi:hypothetical protein QCA50_001648 [Cerrena zonata]|uniref:Uncharacterized protein n=1 Tax=Cerrena zonata TaxID=2478898 RepID=A0AAW0GP98_9APHY